MNQLTLGVDEPRSRRADPDTSRDAAQSITPGRTEARILQVFRWAGRGLTADELVGRFEAEAHDATIKTALSRVAKAGLLVDSGERRLSNRHRQQIVWRLVG